MSVTTRQFGVFPPLIIHLQGSQHQHQIFPFLCATLYNALDPFLLILLSAYTWDLLCKLRCPGGTGDYYVVVISHVSSCMAVYFIFSVVSFWSCPCYCSSVLGFTVVFQFVPSVCIAYKCIYIQVLNVYLLAVSLSFSLIWLAGCLCLEMTKIYVANG
jgi:hypothetical protein